MGCIYEVYVQLPVCFSCSERKPIYLRVRMCVAARCGVSPSKWHIADLHSPYDRLYAGVRGGGQLQQHMAVSMLLQW